ncbi:MAG: glycosyltransferase family 2 protein [Proteobacteria bacterium]|nr:MAG: glycosyltransferase family 2 protein [Pseudomonadota bacterium]
MNSPETTIIIASKNEAKNLRELLPELKKRGWSDILVVDGHSTDETPELCREYGVNRIVDEGRGKGNAVRMGIQAAKTRWVLLMDADGSHVVDDIPLLLEPLTSGQSDLVVASRLLGGSSELHGGFDEFLRLSGSSFITACINYKYKVRLSDSQNGYRAGCREKLIALGMVEDSTTIEQEMLFKALARGMRVSEVPSHEFPRRHGESHIKLRRVFVRYVFSLMKNYFFT